MQLHQSLEILVLLLCSVAQLLAHTNAQQLQPNALFSFGVERPGKSPLSPNDDYSSGHQFTNTEFTFYGRTYRGLFVNTNGLISFTDEANAINYTTLPISPPGGHALPLVAPFWGDVDTRGSGLVFYRMTNDSALLSLADAYVHTGFAHWRRFRSTELVVATWENVGYYNNRDDKLNTFQCVLASDGQNLFALFLYKNIQWTTADGNSALPAQVGFNSGDGVNFYALPMSQTDGVINITSTSNIGVQGAWVFMVSGDRVESGGCVESEDQSVQVYPTYGNILGGDVITIQGCLNGEVICEFDGVRRSATSISNIEALCVVPPLTRVGMVTLRVLVDEQELGTTTFTSVDVEPSHQVDITPNTDTLTFTSSDTLTIEWSPEAFFPQATPSPYRVDITLYELNSSTGMWTLMATLLSNTPNDGSEVVTLVDPLVAASDIAPIAIQVVVNQDSINSSESPLHHDLASDPVGKWSSQFYYLVSSPSAASNGYYHQCQTWYNSQSKDTARTLLETSMTCPPRKEQALLQNSGLKELRMTSYYGNSVYHSLWLKFFHSTAESCFTLRVSQESTPQQECCYDNQGNLLTGPPGGGRVHGGVGRGGHYMEDILPYMLCCKGQVSSCQQLYELRPSDNGEHYNPPSVAWMMGDPHLITLDNHPYTFNGHGEFALIETTDNSLTLQGRMSPLTNTMATVFTALAVQEGSSDIVMVTASNGRGLGVYVNGIRIDLEIITEQVFNGVVIFGKGENSVGVAFSSGAYMEVLFEGGFLSRIAVSLPGVYVGKTRGLLGVYNGDPADDLTARDGEEMDLSVDNEMLNGFGWTWNITEGSSLFTYLSHESFSTLSDPKFMPEFNPDSSTASQELVVACQTDPFCLFDGLVSGDISLASNTLAARREAEVLEELSIEVTCSPSCENGVCVSNNTCACSEGYTGSTCAMPMYETCTYNPCPEGMACGVLGGSHYCSDCTGANSETPLCEIQNADHPCIPNNCKNGGVCVPNTSLTLNFSCICASGYRGILCGLDSNPTSSPCDPNPCQNGGTCSISKDSTSSYQCSCIRGYTGDECSIVSTSIQVAIIAGPVAGSIFLIIMILLFILVCWAVCGRRRNRKHNSESVSDSNIALTIIRPNSVLLEPQKKQQHNNSSTKLDPKVLNNQKGQNLSSSIPEIRSNSTSPRSSDPHLPKAHRLTLSREPLVHNVLVTSPAGDSSTNSLNVHKVTSLQNGKPDSLNNLPLGRSASTLPPTGRSSSNAYYMNTPNGRAQSQLEYYDYLRLHGQQFTSTQSMNLSQQSSSHQIQRNPGRRASLNVVSMSPSYGNGHRGSHVETTEV